jgi:hypothetical protein
MHCELCYLGRMKYSKALSNKTDTFLEKGAFSESALGESNGHTATRPWKVMKGKTRNVQ